AGRRVLVRADLNVPLEDGRVADDTRIRAALPTLRLLLERGASEVVVCSHLGRPKGPDPAFAIEPVRARLLELLGADDRVRVLENTRFDPRETANDPGLAAELAAQADLYVDDAFGSAHRAHASTEGVAHLLPAYAGLLLERELRELGRLLDRPERPFVAIVGGAKVEDKIGVLRSLARRADAVAAFEADAESKVVPADAVREGWLGLDVGPATREAFAGRIATAKTVFWNGPMGVFEWPRFAEGTLAVAQAVAAADAHTV